MNSPLDYEVRDGAAYVTLNRPEALNALNRDLTNALHDAMREADTDDNVRSVVLSGAGGRAFCAGADLKQVADTAAADSRRGGFDRPQLGSMRGFDDVRECSKPVIAAIDGWCVAGGLELALMCDVRCATRQSRFGLPEPRRGMLAGPGLHTLSRVIPLGEALKLQLTGGTIDAVRAYQVGLIQDLLEDRAELDRAVERIVAEIAACSPTAVRYIKRVVTRGREMPIEDAWRMAMPYQTAMAASPDSREGPLAFVQKRDPVWEPPSAIVEPDVV